MMADTIRGELFSEVVVGMMLVQCLFVYVQHEGQLQDEMGIVETCSGGLCSCQ